jgi:hypothetical protein
MSFLFGSSRGSKRLDHRPRHQIDPVTSISYNDHMDNFPDQEARSRVCLRDIIIQAHCCLQKDPTAAPSELSLSNETSPLVNPSDFSHYCYRPRQGRATELIPLDDAGTDVIEVDSMVIMAKQRDGDPSQNVSHVPWLRAVGGATRDVDPERSLRSSPEQIQPDDTHYIAIQGERNRSSTCRDHTYLIYDIPSDAYHRIMRHKIKHEFKGTMRCPTRQAGDFEPVSEFHKAVLPHIMVRSSYFGDTASKPTPAVSVPSIVPDGATTGPASSAIPSGASSNVTNLDLTQTPLIEGIKDYPLT